VPNAKPLRDVTDGLAGRAAALDGAEDLTDDSSNAKRRLRPEGQENLDFRRRSLLAPAPPQVVINV
jgi:hypothetical protein